MRAEWAAARPDPGAGAAVGVAPGEALSLDVAGVLVLPEPTAVLADAAPGEHWDAVHYLVRVRESGAVPLVGWDHVAASVGAPVERVHAYVDRLREVHGRPDVWRRVVPGARELLLAAAAAGVPVAAVSNTVRPMTVEILAAAGLSGDPADGRIPVERTFDSSVLGLAKPDPRVFRRVSAELGRPLDKVVHVGDSLDEDVRGAQGAGAVAVHLTPFGGCADVTHDHVPGLRGIDPTDLRRHLQPLSEGAS
ncbi:hypothetical protein Cch01nite_13380 [Cellulomonas chitinilytica]|uniref:HAD family hydrolase n=1 Tax=Cellulomonas chitinilytica TaxID=398759 RepID=A0A919P385_9CELL|nr:HAD family hydrolase [Cellulomonas chitinilytica]GIG20614.1 hypothetical protein Cch01nite_13380 [Cellulomonas chitinilytica]